MNIDKLKGRMKEKRMTQPQVAEALNMSLKTFNIKLNKGRFYTDEIATLIKLLEIENPVEFFLS